MANRDDTVDRDGIGGSKIKIKVNTPPGVCVNCAVFNDDGGEVPFMVYVPVSVTDEFFDCPHLHPDPTNWIIRHAERFQWKDSPVSVWRENEGVSLSSTKHMAFFMNNATDDPNVDLTIQDDKSPSGMDDYTVPLGNVFLHFSATKGDSVIYIPKLYGETAVYSVPITEEQEKLLSVDMKRFYDYNVSEYETVMLLQKNVCVGKAF